VTWHWPAQFRPATHIRDYVIVLSSTAEICATVLSRMLPQAFEGRHCDLLPSQSLIDASRQPRAYPTYTPMPSITYQIQPTRLPPPFTLISITSLVQRHKSHKKVPGLTGKAAITLKMITMAKFRSDLCSFFSRICHLGQVHVACRN